MAEENAPTGPTITIPGKAVVDVPTLTPADALQNFEQVASNHTCSMPDRLRLMESVLMAASLAGVRPTDVNFEGMLKNFDGLAKAFPCDHDTRMALIGSVQLLADLAEAEEARLAKEAGEANRGDQAPPGNPPAPDGSSEAAGSTPAQTPEAAPSPAQ